MLKFGAHGPQGSLGYAYGLCTACFFMIILHTQLFFMYFHEYMFILPKVLLAIPTGLET